MSSLRNAVKRVTHKERSQPQHRSHLGILEKHKDYTKRAKDYHSKQRKINVLREKAQQRNPDEFYFGMHKSYVDRETGEHKKVLAARQKELEHIIGVDSIKVMKEQDLKAVQLQIQKDKKRVEKLKRNLHLIGVENGVDNNDGTHKINTKKRKQHTIFVDSKEELQEFDVADYFNTVPELAGRAYNRVKVDQILAPTAASLMDGDASESDSENDFDITSKKKMTKKQRKKQQLKEKRSIRKAAKARRAAYREVAAIEDRKEKLLLAEMHLETEKKLQGKGKRRKIKNAQDGKPAVYKWSRIRKR